MARKLTQREVDEIRVRVLLACTISAVEAGVKKPPVRYLWFRRPGQTSPRELRVGNPPPDKSRPLHLRGLHLVIDVGEIPDDVRDAILLQRQQARAAAGEPTRMIDVVTDPRIANTIADHARKGTLPLGG